MPDENKTGEQNAQLAALAEQAKSLDGQQPGVTAQRAEPLAESHLTAESEVFDEAEEGGNLAGLIFMVGQAFVPMFPSLAQVYTEEACGAIAGACVPVMKKRGWSLVGAAGKYKEEFVLAMTLLPIGMATYHAVVHDLAQAAAQPEPGNWFTRLFSRKAKTNSAPAE